MEDMVAEQRAYQTQFQDLMAKYELLVEERKQLQQMFVSTTQEQHQKEALVVNNFKQWMKEREKSLEEHSVYLEDDTTTASLQEEKKIEDRGDYSNLRDDIGEIPTMTRKPGPSPPSIALSNPNNGNCRAAIIDLSNMASPREDQEDHDDEEDAVVIEECSGESESFAYNTPSMD